MNDIKKHIIAGFGAALVVALPVWLECNNLFAGLWACLAGVIAGCVKEWCDNEYGAGFDWRDFACTVAGAAIVAVFIVAMHYAKG